MLSTADLSNWLQTTQIFNGLSPDRLEAIAGIARLRTFQKGDSIFEQGDPATGFFMVKTGQIKAFKLSVQGKEQILHLFSAGDHFAEVPALDGKDFPAAAAAIQSSEIVFFPRIAFLDLLHQYPDITIKMLISLAQHARNLSQTIEDLSFKEVHQRLATYLLTLSDRTNNPDAIELDLSKSQLAAALGTISATLSRAFYRLSHEGMIAIDGSQIELLDRDRLQKISQSQE